MSAFDLKKGGIGPIYPVLVDAYDNIIDGFHRLEVDPNWPKKRLGWVKTERDRVLVRNIANCARRTVSVKERREELTTLAELLRKEGVKSGEIIPQIAKLTPFTYRYVAMLLPDEFKREYKKQVAKSGLPEKEKSEIISQLDSRSEPIKCELSMLLDGLRGLAHRQNPEANCDECEIRRECGEIKEFVEKLGGGSD